MSNSSKVDMIEEDYEEDEEESSLPCDPEKLMDTIVSNVRASIFSDKKQEDDDEDDEDCVKLVYGSASCRSAFKPDMTKLKHVSWKNDDGTYGHSLKVGDEFWVEATHLAWRDTELYRVNSFGENGAVWVRSITRKNGSVFSLTEGLDAGYRYYEGQRIPGMKFKKSKRQKRRRHGM